MIKFEDVSIEEILEIVDKLNQEIYEQTEEDNNMTLTPLEFSCNGRDPILSSAAISFFDFPIWDTEGNERQFIDDKDEYEPLEDYLRREIMNLVNIIKCIKV